MKGSYHNYMDVRVHYIQIEFRRKRKERDEITQKKKKKIKRWAVKDRSNTKKKLKQWNEKRRYNSVISNKQ